MTTTQTRQTSPVSALEGQVARLRRRASGRQERVQVDTVLDMGDHALIMGRLLYSTNRTAYGEHDSRGHFVTQHYAMTDTVDVEPAR